jgi:hypothetical protein
VFFVFVRVPLGGQFFIGILDLVEGDVLWYAEDVVVVFDWLFGAHECTCKIWNIK